MPYQVTAIKDVTIRAYVLGTSIQMIAGRPVRRPNETQTWVSIKAGESARTGLVLGVHPEYLPEMEPTHIKGFPSVLLPEYSPGTLPQDFYGLLRLEFIQD